MANSWFNLIALVPLAIPGSWGQPYRSRRVTQGGRITGTRLEGEQRDQRYRWAKACAVLAALMLVCAGPRGEVAAQGITVTPANPTMSVGQTQQFTASGTVAPTALAAGGLHTCMRLPDGTEQCWGRNNFGQLGNGDGTFQESAAELRPVESELVPQDVEERCVGRRLDAVADSVDGDLEIAGHQTPPNGARASDDVQWR